MSILCGDAAAETAAEYLFEQAAKIEKEGDDCASEADKARDHCASEPDKARAHWKEEAEKSRAHWKAETKKFYLWTVIIPACVLVLSLIVQGIQIAQDADSPRFR